MAPCLRHLPEQVLILAKVMACGNFVKRVRLQELYRSSACSIVDVRCSRKVPSFEWGCECHFRCSEPKLQLSPTTYHAGRDYATNAPVEYHCTKSCQHFIGVDTTLLPSRISICIAVVESFVGKFHHGCKTFVSVLKRSKKGFLLRHSLQLKQSATIHCLRFHFHFIPFLGATFLA